MFPGLIVVGQIAIYQCQVGKGSGYIIPFRELFPDFQGFLELFPGSF